MIEERIGPPGGSAYDPAAQIEKPAAARSPTWRNSPEGQRLDGDCVRTSHLVGAYYRWEETCEPH